MLAEHGLAFWIETDSNRMLFDTGQGQVIMGNARHLGVQLELCDTIILSHGHYDHIGGLGSVLDTARRTKICAHPASIGKKYVRREDGSTHDIGVRVVNEPEGLQRAEELIFPSRPTEVCPGIFVTGEIPRVTDFEDTGGSFFLDEHCRQPDPLDDDQALFFESSNGIVVLLGCAHAGVVNTIQYIREVTGNKPIHAVLGGMHLTGASAERLHQTIEAFRRFRLDLVGPAHCTGMPATAALWAALPGKCFACPVGTKMEFRLP
jgi:7,8-dihydropterin-6-yl-methyl-4-(beta-D-ribofuranosyl)aminobenzene 5'-phosphate synthase